jgi:hypothetical protein
MMKARMRSWIALVLCLGASAFPMLGFADSFVGTSPPLSGIMMGADSVRATTALMVLSLVSLIGIPLYIAFFDDRVYRRMIARMRDEEFLVRDEVITREEPGRYRRAG